MNKSIKVGIIALFVLLSVGFAAVAANLIINGNANIATNTNDFNVYFSKAVAEEGGTATISSDKKSITYSTNTLLNPGDKAELRYRVTNDASQYDAYINMIMNIDNQYADYISISYDVFDPVNDQLVDAKSSREGKITIELTRPVVDSLTIEFTVQLNISAVERTSIGEEVRYDASEIEYSHGYTVHNVKEALDDLRRRLS
jgi:hypothetical protein